MWWRKQKEQPASGKGPEQEAAADEDQSHQRYQEALRLTLNAARTAPNMAIDFGGKFAIALCRGTITDVIIPEADSGEQE